MALSVLDKITNTNNVLDKCKLMSLQFQNSGVPQVFVFEPLIDSLEFTLPLHEVQEQ